MKIFGFIPARMSSSRLPGKPLRLINGKPMLEHVYEREKSVIIMISGSEVQTPNRTNIQLVKPISPQTLKIIFSSNQKIDCNPLHLKNNEKVC